MARHDLFPRIVAFAAIPVLIVFAIPAFSTQGMSGSSISKNFKSPALEADLGSRFLQPLPQKTVAGSKFQAIVWDPSKLAGLGFSGVKPEDKIVVTFLDDGGRRFSVTHGTAGQTRVFAIDDKGAVRAVPVPAGAGTIKIPEKTGTGLSDKQ